MTSIPVTKSSSLKTKPHADELGFGKFFTDHMYVSYYKAGKWLPGQIVPYGPLPIDPAASAIHYGQSLFEGMKAFKKTDNQEIVIFRPEYNWKRLCLGAERLCMPAPAYKDFLEGLRALIRVDSGWVPTAPGASLYIRPTLFATEGFLGVRPANEYCFLIILSPVSSYYGNSVDQGVKIWIETEFIRAAKGGLGYTKAAANYANSLFAATRAKSKGYAQVLWLDQNRTHVEEVGTMNVFFKIDGKVITPSLDGTILAGGVRDSALCLLRDWQIPVEERPLALQEILTASKNGKLEECFGTGTAAVITPVSELSTNSDKIILPSSSFGPLAQRLYDHLSQLQRGQIPDTKNWLTPLA